jgi:hypothetical protein
MKTIRRFFFPRVRVPLLLSLVLLLRLDALGSPTAGAPEKIIDPSPACCTPSACHRSAHLSKEAHEIADSVESGTGDPNTVPPHLICTVVDQAHALGR